MPRPKKCEGMILDRKKFTGLFPSLNLDGNIIKRLPCSRLLEMIVDDGLTWAKHISELKNGFANKRILLKRSRFLPRPMILDRYKVIVAEVSEPEANERGGSLI